LPRKGFRFVGDIHEKQASEDSGLRELRIANDRRATPALPSPISRRSPCCHSKHERDPEQEYFADGNVEDVISALSRKRWLFVIDGTQASPIKGALCT